jgi:hypothetical protein
VSRLDEVLGTALLKGKRAQGAGREVVTVPLEALLPSPQPRRRFENLEALAQSIREKGVLQPLLVRPLGDGRYAIVAGERRYRAAKMAGLAEVPVRVLDLLGEGGPPPRPGGEPAAGGPEPLRGDPGGAGPPIGRVGEDEGGGGGPAPPDAEREARGKVAPTFWAPPRPSGWRRSLRP